MKKSTDKKQPTEGKELSVREFIKMAADDLGIKYIDPTDFETIQKLRLQFYEQRYKNKRNGYADFLRWELRLIGYQLNTSEFKSWWKSLDRRQRVTWMHELESKHQWVMLHCDASDQEEIRKYEKWVKSELTKLENSYNQEGDAKPANAHEGNDPDENGLDGIQIALLHYYKNNGKSDPKEHWTPRTKNNYTRFSRPGKQGQEQRQNTNEGKRSLNKRLKDLEIIKPKLSGPGLNRLIIDENAINDDLDKRFK